MAHFYSADAAYSFGKFDALESKGYGNGFGYDTDQRRAYDCGYAVGEALRTKSEAAPKGCAQ